MENKKKIVIGLTITLTIIVLVIIGIIMFKKIQIKNATVIVDLKENLDVEFLMDLKVTDLITNINGKLVDDYKIDTKTVGEQEIKFEYINEDNIKVPYSFKINIVDTTAPIIWLSGSYSINVGSDVDLTKKILCGDNYDSNPVCEVIGDYDASREGSYPLVFKATDSSGNTTEKNFKLNVVTPKPGNQNTFKNVTKFSDVIANYKSENTEIGIDISHWQGDVDFNKLKEAGVEFVFIRVGTAKGIDGEYVLDRKFEQNIKRANEVGIPVGIYFYSYANTNKRAIEDAAWILDQIKDYKIDLPIAFDWENWSSFNDFHMSFFGLTDAANNFLDVFKGAGYEGLLYSSKNYLEQIWLETDYPVWLAHYTKKTNYEGDFRFWQLCSNGRVDGIDGDVDIDIRYK